MILRDVLKYAILYLGYADTIDLDDRSVNENNNKDVKTLVRCANLTYNELISDYLPIYKTETIEFKGGFCPYTALSEAIIDVFSLKNGENIPYKLDATGIYADTKKAEIVYSYSVDNLRLDSEIELGAKITAKAFSLGVCAEFCLINNLFEESIAFEKRYKANLKELLRKKSEMRVKSRRWY